MYKPSYLPTRQSGGDYVSTLSTISTPDITLSSLQYIMQQANITSLDALTSLTKYQISSLAVAVDRQIQEDQTQIALNQASIAQITAMINGPNGLQAKFDLADQQYQSSFTAYNLISTLVLQDQAKYASDISTLRNLYSLSTSYVSSINSYQGQYDSLLSSLQVNASSFTLYQKDYQASLQNLNRNSVNYSSALVNLSTISSVLYNDSIQVPVNLPVYTNDFSTFNNISTQVVNYNISDAIFKASIVSSYNNISTILGPSSFVMFEAGTLLSTIEYYQGMDTVTDSTISSLQQDVSRLSLEISSLTNSNSILLGSMRSEIASVLATGRQFYNLYTQGTNAECDEYLYGIQELNSQLGYITASLGIARNANLVAIDNYTFTILSNPTDTITPGLKSALSVDNNIIYQLMQFINSLDAPLANIIKYIETEKTERNNFIQKRKDIFTNFDAPALGWTPQEIADNQARYFEAFVDLNRTIDTINQCVSRRGTIIQGIQTSINNPITGQSSTVHQLINHYFQLYLGSNGDEQLPDNLLLLLDDYGNPLGGSLIVKEYNPPNTSLTSIGVDYIFIPSIAF